MSYFIFGDFSSKEKAFRSYWNKNIRCVLSVLCFLYISENLYFTNAQSEDTYVEVSRLDASYRLILYVAENEKPQAIAVNPIKR